jgi:hypothetical protein
VPIHDRLPLEDGVHVAVFDVLSNRIKGNPDLKRVVRFFRTWDGDEDDAELWDASSLQGMAGIMLAPSIEERGYVCENALGSKLVVKVEMAIPSTRVRDHFRLWRAVKKACARNIDFDAALYSAGAYPNLVNAGGLEFSGSPFAGVSISSGTLTVDVKETL